MLTLRSARCQFNPPVQVLAELSVREHARMAEDVLLGCRYLHELQPPVVAALSAHSVLVGSSFSCKVRVELLASTDSSAEASAEESEKGPQRENLWCSPEVLDGGALSMASDVYAFGIILVEIFTGRFAFRKKLAEMVRFGAIINPFPAPCCVYHQSGNLEPASNNSLSAQSIEMLFRQITTRDIRPEFPEAFPAGVRNLAAICWSPLAARRPSFPEAQQLYAEATKARSRARALARSRDRTHCTALVVARFACAVCCCSPAVASRCLLLSTSRCLLSQEGILNADTSGVAAARGEYQLFLRKVHHLLLQPKNLLD